MFAAPSEPKADASQHSRLMKAFFSNQDILSQYWAKAGLAS